MEGEPSVWSSLFPWGQRVNLPVMVAKRPRLHVLEGAAIIGALLPGRKRNGKRPRAHRSWVGARSGSDYRRTPSPLPPAASVPCRSGQSPEWAATIGAPLPRLAGCGLPPRFRTSTGVCSDAAGEVTG